MSRILQIASLLLFSLSFLSPVSLAKEVAPDVCAGCVYSSSEATGSNAQAAICGLALRVRLTGTSGECFRDDEPFGACVQDFPCRVKLKVEYQSTCDIVFGLLAGGTVINSNTLVPTAPGAWGTALSVPSTNLPCGAVGLNFQAIIGDANGGLAWVDMQVNCSPC